MYEVSAEDRKNLLIFLRRTRLVGEEAGAFQRLVGIFSKPPVTPEMLKHAEDTVKKVDAEKAKKAAADAAKGKKKSGRGHKP